MKEIEENNNKNVKKETIPPKKKDAIEFQSVNHDLEILFLKYNNKYNT